VDDKDLYLVLLDIDLSSNNDATLNLKQRRMPFEVDGRCTV
jgi:hypothetical protein